MPPIPTFVPYVAGAGLAGFGLWKFLHRKPHVQSMTVGDDAGNTATVSVPATDDDPQMSASVTPPTSDDVSQVVTDSDVADNVVAEPDGRGGYVHRRHRRRFIPPPITPGLIPYAPQIATPYGVAPLTIRSPYDVQYGLNALGYGPLKVDGRIGPISHAAIVEFQNRNGLPPVGYQPALRSHLQNALARAMPRITAPGTRPIIVGRTRDGAPIVHGEAAMHGVCIGAEAVVATANPATPAAVAKVVSAATGAPPAAIAIVTPAHVQAALNAAGATPALKVDGTLGPKSIAATKAFQISAGLVADGVPGPKTRTALAVAVAPPGVCVPCSCPVPTPVSFPYEPVLEGRNELFKGWAATHHLGNRVDCGRYEFGLEGAEGTGPEASAYFKNAHLPFGSEPQSCAPPHTPYYGASFKCAHSPFGGASFKNAHSPFGAHGGGGHGGGHGGPPTSGVPTGASNPTHAPPPAPPVGQRPVVAAAVQASSPAPYAPSLPTMLPTAGPGGYGSQSYGSGPAMLSTWSPPSQGGYGGGAGYAGGYGGFSSGGFYGEAPFEDTLADVSTSYGTHTFGAAGKKQQFAKPKGPRSGWGRRKAG